MVVTVAVAVALTVAVAVAMALQLDFYRLLKNSIQMNLFPFFFHLFIHEIICTLNRTKTNEHGA